MEINTSMNVSGVNGFFQPGRPAPVAKTTPDIASFPGVSGLEAALGTVPESRPEAVALGKSLINDPSYPSSSVVSQLAKHLARNLGSQD